MTEAELEELLNDCPVLYHMAERDSWKSISKHGLLSTSALLDLYEVNGAERSSIESSHRPTSNPIESPTLEGAVIRDQKPMSDSSLSKCLNDNLTPSDWYRMLNSRVFFWLTEERLLRLLGAREYKNLEHDVLVVNSQSLVERHYDDIWLCPMNSGNTRPFPHPRGVSTFQRIRDYPYKDWRKKRKRGERAVELCVDGGVYDIVDHVHEVRRMSGAEAIKLIYSAQ